MTPPNEINQLIENLFRQESGKLIAVLTRIFGADQLELAEDVVQDAFMEAIRCWSGEGVPQNEVGWLYRVAKNKALNIVNRDQYKRQYSSDVLHLLQSPWTSGPASEFLFSEEEILDDQLRMMFTCCHPSISPDSQIALILKTLCGFGIPEIGKAFLTTTGNINKRLVRARKKIRFEKIPFEVPDGDQLQSKAKVVLEAIYLLFNEGYKASSGASLVRFGLCEEAIRLTNILIAHPAIADKADAYALLALMQLNASRFNARQDKEGNIITLADQNRTLWDQQLIGEGLTNLARSATPDRSIYHILAYISAYHCMAKDDNTTNWEGILALYDQLLQIAPSPLVLLNRSIAVGKVKGAAEALVELKKVEDIPSMQSYHLFYSVQAELFLQDCQFEEAMKALKKAITLTTLPAERNLLEKRLKNCMEKQLN